MYCLKETLKEYNRCSRPVLSKTSSSIPIFSVISPVVHGVKRFQYNGLAIVVVAWYNSKVFVGEGLVAVFVKLGHDHVGQAALEFVVCCPHVGEKVPQNDREELALGFLYQLEELENEAGIIFIKVHEVRAVPHV